MPDFKTIIFRACIIPLTAVLAFFAFTADGAIEGSWRSHQALDRTVSRIIDGERYVTLLCQDMQMRMNSNPYNQSRPHIFRIDKTDADATWRSLADDFSLSSRGFVTDVLYQPIDKFLMVVYEDNNIDLIYDNGQLVRIPDLALRVYTENIKVANICFDIDRRLAYLATDTGFITVDTAQGIVRNVSDLGFGCLYAARAGDNMLIVKNDGSLWTASVADNSNPDAYTLFRIDSLQSEASATWIKDNSPVNIRNFMPLNDKVFVYVSTPSATQTTGSVMAAVRLYNGKWEAGNINVRGAATTTLEFMAAQTHGRSYFYHNAVPNRDGYLLKTANDIAQLRRDIPADGNWSEFANNLRTSKFRNASEYNFQAGSWDFTEVYLYEERRKLYAATATGEFTSTKWDYGKDYGLPDAPLVGITNNVEYIPGYGIATVCYSYNPFVGGSDPQVPAMLSWYRDGHWTPLSHQHRPPSWLLDSANGYSAVWQRIMEYYPTNNPDGLTPDPDRPGFVYTGSTTHGITRFDLNDPDAPFLRITHSQDIGFDLPGSIAMVPTLRAWSRLCCFSKPQFDNAGNLWALYSNPDLNPPAMELWRWSPEDRIASAKANTDPASFRPWKKMVLDVGFSGGNQEIALPVTIEGGETRLFITPNIQDGPCIIYDHKGTLDDQSDDEFEIIRKFRTPDGGVASTGYLAYAVNDPYTRKVWLGGSTGVHTFDPTTPLDDINMETPQFSFRDDSSRHGAFFEHTGSRAMSIDASGRKWFATSGLGVVIVSVDGKTIEGVLDMSNSPLPSNTIVGIGCDRETGIVMISTDRGLMEFRPSGLPSVPQGIKATATPSVVRPGCHIPVRLTGLPSGCDIHVRDAKGKIVRNIGHAPGGVIQWDTLDSHGNRLPTGIYRITDGIKGSTLAEIKYL